MKKKDISASVFYSQIEENGHRLLCHASNQ